MFTPLSSNLVVLFPSEEEALKARNAWTVAFRGKVVICIYRILVIHLIISHL
jgi:hypothetical protein